MDGDCQNEGEVKQGKLPTGKLFSHRQTEKTFLPSTLSLHLTNELSLRIVERAAGWCVIFVRKS
jgi:hypothetical protein